jgi:hypothetical protein
MGKGAYKGTGRRTYMRGMILSHFFNFVTSIIGS